MNQESLYSNAFGNFANWGMEKTDPEERSIMQMLDELSIYKKAKAPAPEEKKPLSKRVDDLLALHKSTPHPIEGKADYCSYCSSSYPCQTVRILNGNV